MTKSKHYPFVLPTSEPKNSVPDVDPEELAAFAAGGDCMHRTRADEEGGYPWQAPHIREDVTRGHFLRLPEPYDLKLRWLYENGLIEERGPRGPSMHELMLRAVTARIDELITKCTND